MRVLHFTVSFVEGGRRRAMTTLMRELRALGVECDLASVRDLGCSDEEAAHVAGAALALEQRKAFDRRAVQRLRQFCLERRIDVIHSHDAAAQFVAAQMRLRQPRIPLLMTFHRSRGFESARFRDKMRNAFSSALSAAIVTGSRERREHFVRENYVSRKKMVRIPFGVDTERFHPDPNGRAQLRSELGIEADALVVGAAGHFREVKGMDLIVRAFQSAAAQGFPSPTVLVVVGDGPPERRELLARLADSGPGRVIFAGFRQDIERWFQGFDVFVHGARLEAFGLVLAEAMATGLPIVAPRVGGIPDIVRDGETGILVSPESPEELARGIGTLVGDSETRNRMGANARGIAQTEFTARKYAERHLQLYQDLAAGRPPRCDDRTRGERETANSRPNLIRAEGR